MRSRKQIRSIAAVGIVAVATGCGTDDAEVFGEAQLPPPSEAIIESTSTTDSTTTTTPSTTTSSSTTSTTTSSSTTSTATAPTAPTDSTTPSAATTPSAPTDSTTSSTNATTVAPAPAEDAPVAAFPDGGELLVDFTFTATSTGERIHNPYIAVWIEDLDGNLVDTVSLWYQTGGRGTRWLRTLRQWSDATGEAVDATSSGATRPAGTYTVAWDGLGADGLPIAPGSYQLFVEAAREDGPYELSSAVVDFDGTEFAVGLPDDGELMNLAARLVA